MSLARRRHLSRPARLLLLAMVLALIVGSASAQPAGPPGEQTLLMTLSELETEISRREEDLERYQERLDELSRQNDEVRQRLEAREAELRRQERHVRERIVTLCRLNRGGYIQLLRGAQTWAGVVRRAQIARSVVERDVVALRAHQGRAEALERQRLELTRRLETQNQLRERIARYREELSTERQRRLAHGLVEEPPVSQPALDDGLDQDLLLSF